MTFEEKINCPGHKERQEGQDCTLCGLNHTVTYELVDKYCLSKQTVRRMIKRVDTHFDHDAFCSSWDPSSCEAKKELLKELGLDK